MYGPKAFSLTERVLQEFLFILGIFFCSVPAFQIPYFCCKSGLRLPGSIDPNSDRAIHLFSSNFWHIQLQNFVLGGGIVLAEKPYLDLAT